ncbi:hypothetical protein OH749_31390 (plasmid) [Streptomyces albidoflavus]|uniref:hypothetical protein n=1 Tax=Streptomyces TaxID=1883 RepID=UPI00342F9D29|nr:hypothetical protein OH749_31390 [Streptomyces albidoflavus]
MPSADSLQQTIKDATEERATALDASLPDDERREAAESADIYWRSIMHVATRLAEVCKTEGEKLSPQFRALAPDDYSREALELDDLRRTWIAATYDMEALAAHAALRQDAERMLSAERAG